MTVFWVGFAGPFDTFEEAAAFAKVLSEPDAENYIEEVPE